MRILLYTGKGGVGKTSVSAATALRCADLGYRTVVMSTDAAHSLADSLDMPLGPEPVPVAPNLWGQELDVLYQMDKYWNTVQEYFTALMAWRGMDALIAEETAVLPGMEELASLLQVVGHYDSGDYDVIIVDCAPTGATLQLLTIPEIARWYLQRIFPIKRQAMKLVRPLAQAILDMPLPDDKLFNTVESLIKELDRMQGLLSNPQLSSIRLVLNPEKMVIKESQRAYTYLCLYNYPVDLVVSNRLIPSQVSDAYFTSWREIQAKYSQQVEEAFAPLPIFLVPLFDQEVVGLTMLRRMAESIYGDKDPTTVFYAGQTQKVEKVDGTYRLRIRLPFTSKEALQLTSAADELIIHIGNHKRNLILPRTLATLDVQEAKLDDNMLTVTFGNRK
jgi:arsenite-transporting ATPase